MQQVRGRAHLGSARQSSASARPVLLARGTSPHLHQNTAQNLASGASGVSRAPFAQSQYRGQSHSLQRNVAAQFSASDLTGLGLFLTPGALAMVYAFIKGKGNLKDGLSRVLTEVSQGYFQPDVGGKNIPVSQGELSDLAGDEPLFKALYKW